MVVRRRVRRRHDHDQRGAGSTTAAGGPATGEPIKIGVMASLTGMRRACLPGRPEGYQLEVEAFNAAGGVNGRPIELIEIDDKSDAATAVSVATKLITQDKVVALIGGLNTPAALAVEPLAEQVRDPVHQVGHPDTGLPGHKRQMGFHRQRGPGGCC